MTIAVKYVSKIFNLKIVIIISLLAVLANSSCLNIRSKYEPTSFYLLSQEPLLLHFKERFKDVLIVREFGVSAEYDSERILIKDKDEAKRLFYHRWLNEPSKLISDFIITRFNRHEVFEGGVVTPRTISVADYYLEGQVLEMIAVNSDSMEPGANYINISIKISLIKRQPLKADETVVLSKIFDNKTLRQNNALANIAEAFSKGFSEITDSIMDDIVKSIRDRDIN